MKNTEPAQQKKLSPQSNTKDILGFIIFLLIPLSFFFSNFVINFKVYYYAILALFVAIYTLVGQFFFEEDKISSLGKKLISLTVINTLIISFINFTGNVSSPYYFILYFLLIFVAFFTSTEVLILESVIIFFSIFITEIYKFSSLSLLFQSIDTQALANFLSIPLSLPLVVVISTFVKNLQKKQDLLLLSKELLTIKDIEDEALLEEVNQGVIVIDSNLKIAKISKWIENKFSLSAKFLLGKNFTELKFYDPVSNQKFLPSDYFYKNLSSTHPQKLTWRVLYKNQYGKFKKFIIKQSPLLIKTSSIGFLISVKIPPKTASGFVSSFNQLLNFRISSSIAVVKSSLSILDQTKMDSKYSTLQKHINLIVQILNDATIKNEITDGKCEMTLSLIDLKAIAKSVVEKLTNFGKIAMWNISPLYKNKSINIKTDSTLCEKLLTYAIKGSFFLSKNLNVSLAFDEDENLKKPSIIITTDVDLEIPENIDILQPFFSGELAILSNYKGSGLEFSNANLIANFLGFDFNVKISNNKLIVKIIF